MEAPDLLQISLGTTRGLRVSDAAFAELAARAGVSVETVAVRIGATDVLRRGHPVNDLVEAVAARRAVSTAVRRLAPRAIVFSTTTAAMLAPRLGCPYAVRLDSPARLNRPGSLSRPLHALEQRRLAAARLVLPWSHAAADALPGGVVRTVVLPPPLSVLPADDGRRDRLAIAYTPDPKAKGLELLCRAWARAAIGGARLEVFGIEPERALHHLRRSGLEAPPGVIWRGLTAPDEFHEALRRSRAFITSARWEDFGMAQLEALALGSLLVCTATSGPFEALSIASELAPELVATDRSAESLSKCLQTAFFLPDATAETYRHDARVRLNPYLPDAVARTIREEVLPTLLPDWAPGPRRAQL